MRIGDRIEPVCMLNSDAWGRGSFRRVLSESGVYVVAQEMKRVSSASMFEIEEPRRLRSISISDTRRSEAASNVICSPYHVSMRLQKGQERARAFPANLISGPLKRDRPCRRDIPSAANSKSLLARGKREPTHHCHFDRLVEVHMLRIDMLLRTVMMLAHD